MSNNNSSKFNIKITKKTILLFVIVFAVSLSIFTVARVSIYKKLNQPIFHGDDDTPDIKNGSNLSVVVSSANCAYPEAFADGKRINFLILGVATTTTGKDLTDTIMLCSYDTENYTFDLISIPRDTYYNRAKYSIWSGNQKINSIYETDGIVGIASAVSDILSDIPVNYYFTVEYNDIKLLVDAIGGVDIDVPFDLRYEDPTDDPPLNINIPAGRQHITSKNVVELLRFRKTNPWFADQGYKSYSDFGRMEMQQQFITACLKKTLSKASYIKKVLEVAIDNIGSNITYDEALSLASDVTKLDMSNVHTYTIPTHSRGTSETGGTSFLFIEDDDAANIVQILDGIFLNNKGSN